MPASSSPSDADGLHPRQGSGRGRQRGGREPGRFVLAALVLTLVLALILGANVVTTGVYHRSVAEGVLRDYAGFATSELETRVQAALAQRLFPVLSLLGARSGAAGTPLTPPGELRPALDTAVWRPLRESMTVFRIAPAGSLETTGAELAEASRALLTDSLPGRARAVLSRTAYFAFFWLPDGDRVVVFNAMHSTGSGDTLLGVVVPVAAIPPLLSAAIARAPLLPPTLTGGTRLDSAVAYRVLLPTGRALLESAAGPESGFAAERELPPMWGGLRVAASLRPSLAGKLVIGGLPRSRLPLVIALLAVNALLVAMAGFQLRRERELSRLREEFVAGVSHELRTPLAQIRLFTETLRLGRVRNDAERERALEIVDQETRRLSHLVENLLQVSRAGRMPAALVARPRDVAALLRDAAEGFAPVAAGRRTALAIHAPPELTWSVDGDAFRQIVLNLLDNAVKYGPGGQTVTVALAEANGRLRLRVDDQGPGVPAAERLRVFERFVRLERDREAHTTGTGLGLAMVRELARRHGGEARAEAAPGGGARLVVELPASPSAAEA